MILSVASICSVCTLSMLYYTDTQSLQRPAMVNRSFKRPWPCLLWQHALKTKSGGYKLFGCYVDSLGVVSSFHFRLVHSGTWQHQAYDCCKFLDLPIRRQCVEKKKEKKKIHWINQFLVSFLVFSSAFLLSFRFDVTHRLPGSI